MASQILYRAAAFAAVAITTGFAAPSGSPPTVHAAAGIFVGNTSITGLDQFLGIPYAMPPLGPLRFTNPQPFPVKALGNPFLATEYSPGCLQDPLYALYNGLSEDCLTLNVIRPQGLPSTASLPVLFWIHGGGNENGQSIFYNGTALVQYSVQIGQPIIYVACNYRLGGFGFLNSPAFQAEGISNLGLKDQYLALQWAHENIASFGGNPNKVVIFGESAGAWDAQAQMHRAYTLNETNRLFQGMITESGAFGGLGAPLVEKPAAGLAAYNVLLNQTNCLNASDTVACLRTVDVSILSPLLVEGAFGFLYTLDNDWFKKNLTEILVDYEFAQIPFIHGCNLDEGSVFMADPFNPPNSSALVEYITPLLSNQTSLAQGIIQVYENLSDVSLGKGYNADPTAGHPFWTAVGVYGDVNFHLGRRAFLKLGSTKVPAWGYYFRQQPPLTQLNLSYEYPGMSTAYDRRVAVEHGAELAYVFGEASHLQGATAGDVNVSTTVMSAWISFAYKLDPNADGVPQWPRYNQSKEGITLVLANQGNETISAQPDILRQPVYNAWNTAMKKIGQAALF
ncbi:uncharacterized protein Z520_02638 [Fonsecaea multimorphosa CBS 102226]|uniref:Carboxylic ester hydrolase n=1 Tax=Fonsecaea multimorphosa CBS 102226 TaxID=1442371 RepID=A0A0D2HGP8_9EURO|nr:uncharacterized protein Z520_02638 [Fonsecaea multimorphosa CBS 102226]KIY01086.1 hypothetical protein Z520_02638 [Fonsecaea multimorphosa CBS 102226]OAL28706.1 hypothetical protein AYO22_02571 [Fonsecaea multimorphosa]